MLRLQELAIDEMNAGIYAFEERELRDAVPRLRDDNAQKEFYLTDTVDDFVSRGKAVRPVLSENHLDVLGINDRVELARARKEMNARLCERHMRRRRHDRRSRDNLSRTGTRDRARYRHLSEHRDLAFDGNRRALHDRAQRAAVECKARQRRHRRETASSSTRR